MTLAQVADSVCRPLLDQATGYASAAIRGEDAGAIHDMRVALRRLRTALEFFAPAYSSGRDADFAQACRRITRALGQVRDDDVQLAGLRSALGGATLAERPGIGHALERLGRHRRRRLARFAVEYSQFDPTSLPQATESAGAPLASYVARKLDRLTAAFVRRAERAIDEGQNKRLHRARLAGKLLRYSVEFNKALLTEDHQLVLERLGALQDRFGAINDADRLARSCRRLAGKLAAGDPRLTGLHALLVAARRDRIGALTNLRAQWSSRAAPYPELLRASIAASLPDSSGIPKSRNDA